MHSLTLYYGQINKKYAWEFDIFRKIRHFKDGITFFNLDICFDLYKEDHKPSFTIVFEIFNFKIFEFSIYNINHLNNTERD